jgi:competence protein ComGC
MRRDRTKIYSAEPAYDPKQKQFGEVERPQRGWDRVHVNLAVSFGIVAILIGLFLYALRGLPQRLQETGCMGRLRQVGQVLTMYSTDHEEDPPVSEFPFALYPYVRGADTLSEEERDEDQEIKKMKGMGWRATVPPEARKLFVCPADRREKSLNSYLLVDQRNFSGHAREMSESVQPWVVDEVFHLNHTTILHRDGHTEPVDKEAYLHSTRPLFNIRQPGEGPR